MISYTQPAADTSLTGLLCPLFSRDIFFFNSKKCFCQSSPVSDYLLLFQMTPKSKRKSIHSRMLRPVSRAFGEQFMCYFQSAHKSHNASSSCLMM